MQEVRIEKDSMGEMEVDNSKYWGAQTQRSYNNFPIGIEKMPKEITKAFAYLKQACAATNFSFGKLDERRYKAITQACQDVLQVSSAATSRSPFGRRALARSPT